MEISQVHSFFIVVLAVNHVLEDPIKSSEWQVLCVASTAKHWDAEGEPMPTRGKPTVPGMGRWTLSEPRARKCPQRKPGWARMQGEHTWLPTVGTGPSVKEEATRAQRGRAGHSFLEEISIAELQICFPEGHRP